MQPWGKLSRWSRKKNICLFFVRFCPHLSAHLKDNKPYLTRRSVANHQRCYIALALLAFLAFAATFAQLLLMDRWHCLLTRYIVLWRKSLVLPMSTESLIFKPWFSWLLAVGLFFLRFALVLLGLYSFLMATIFNRFLFTQIWRLPSLPRRERHALLGGKATLSLLHSRAGYGAI